MEARLQQNLLSILMRSQYTNVHIGSLADLLTDSSLTAAFERKADVHVGQFCENLGDVPECPLFSKADVQAPR